MRRTAPAAACLLLAAFSLGALRSGDIHAAYRGHPLRALDLPGIADIEGLLVRSPGRGAELNELVVDVESILHRKRLYRPGGRLRVSVPVAAPPEEFFLKSLHPGDRVVISARLSTRPGFRNIGFAPGGRRLELLGFHRTAFAKSALLVTLKARGSKFDPRRWASSLRRALLDKIEDGFPSPLGGGPSDTGAVLQAILLGERGRLRADVESSLQESGLFHLIAISGAHVAVLAGMAHVLLTLAGAPRRASALILVPFLAFYALMVEGRASVLRAVLMASLVFLGKALWKDVRLLNTVSLSAFLLLLLNPTVLWEAGFQLTFAATYSLILFVPRILKRLPQLPLRLGELFAASLAAHLGVSPILASAFNRVVLAGLVLNLAAVPLTAAVMISGYAFLLLSNVHPLAGKVSALGADFTVRALLFLSRLPGQTPPLSYRLPSPPPVVLALYALSLIGLLLPRRSGRRGAVLLVLHLAAFALLAVHPFPPRGSPGLRLTVLDVGQGESILVEFPGRKKMLVDGGGLPGGDFDVGESVVCPVLWRAGMKKVDILVSTHAHSDHAGGLRAVARNFGIGEVWEPAGPPDDPWRLRFLEAIPPSVPIRRPTAGGSLRVSGVLVEVLNPPASGDAPRAVDNETSLVLRLTYGRVSMLLAADIGRETERRLSASGTPLESAVLKTAHHGSASSTGAEFLGRVNPRLAVVSCGADNAFGFPSAAVVGRLERAGARVFRTDRDGAVECSTDGRTVEIRTAAGHD
jgi:competence protein ComEC